MRRFKSRKGVFVVMFGILFVGLMLAAAVSIDLSRTWAFRNELQTSADAAALAGAIQLSGNGLNAANAANLARKYAYRNKSLQDSVDVDSVTLGFWDEDKSTFADTGSVDNAVRVVVSHDVTSLWISKLATQSLFKIHARAIAWADAGVSISTCMKPWAIPYPQLIYKVDSAQGIPINGSTDYGRTFTQTDLDILKTMTVPQRTFSLKIGSGQQTDTLGKISGNYQAVDLPPKYIAPNYTTTNPAWSSGNGGDTTRYKQSVSGQNCFTISVGDILAGKTGNMAGPTINGANGGDDKDPPGICKYIVGDKGDPAKPPVKADDPTYGDCINPETNLPGVDIKTAFYYCESKCNGYTEYKVKMLGSFTLLKVYPGDVKCTGSSPAGCKPRDKAEIVGAFNPIQDTGAVGPSASTIRRIILVECAASRSANFCT